LPFLACCPLPAVYYFLPGLLDSRKGKVYKKANLARMFHELLSRDREDGRATGLAIVDCGMRIAD